MRTGASEPRAVPSTAARLAAVFAFLSVLALLAGPAGIHLGLFRPFAGFLVTMGGLILGGLLSLFCGVAGVVATLPGKGRSGRGRAWLGVLVGAALLGTLGALLARSGGAPRIHDITTNPDDPPAYTQALEAPDNAGRNLTYPEGAPDAAEQQRQAYPDLKPLSLAVPPAEAFAQAHAAIARLGWKPTFEDPAAGLLEAEDTSRLFLFVDDVVVRVRASGDGSVVDVRSTSRVGKGDLGANAARIRRFLDALQAPRGR
jgi:uncharacterized protein (DUF1499 family)